MKNVRHRKSLVLAGAIVKPVCRRIIFHSRKKAYVSSFYAALASAAISSVRFNGYMLTWVRCRAYLAQLVLG